MSLLWCTGQLNIHRILSVDKEIVIKDSVAIFSAKNTLKHSKSFVSGEKYIQVALCPPFLFGIQGVIAKSFR